MLPQQGIMSLAKPRAQQSSPQADQAVDQVLNSTTQMLGKLDNKTLGLLLQLTQYLKDHKSKYPELMAKLEKKGSLPPGVFPKNYDPKFLSVFALSVSKAQQGGMASGGIASIAQTLKNQGRGKDTMLAHISPKEAVLLKKHGGVGTTNPATGLPEFGIFEDIGNALSGVGNAVGSVLKPVGDLIGGIVSSPLGLAATAAAAYYFMGPSAGAVVPSVAEAALPGEVAGIGAAAHLTPAAIESGIGSAGYGTNASAAASGLFNPATIGSGAEIGAPSTTDKLLSANLLKNVKLSPGEEEPASDPNALIKMLMMFEMMNNKQSQPTNAVVPALAENTSNLPYDNPKKPTYPLTQHAAGGGLMTKHLGIGGLSANRSQTDYAKNYLPGSGYRPGQGGVTYFTPMEYTDGETSPTGTTTTNPVQDLVDQTIGKTGGGGGGRSQEQRDQAEADLDRKDDYLGMTMRDYWNLSADERKSVDAAAAERNPIRGGILKAVKTLGYPMILQVIDALKNTKDTVQQTWADNKLRSLGIDPKIVLANQNEIAGLSMQKALESLGQNTTPNFTEKTPGEMAGTSMQRALESLGQNTTPSTTLGTPNEIAGSDMQKALNSLIQNPNVIAGTDMQQALDLNKPKTTDDVIRQLIANSNEAASASQNAVGIPSTTRETTTPEAQANKIAELTNIAGQNSGSSTKLSENEKRAQMLAAQTGEESLASALGSNYTPRSEEGQAAAAKVAQRIADQEQARSDSLAASIAADPVRAAQEQRLKYLLGQTDEQSIKAVLGDDYTPKEKTPDDVEKKRQDQIVQSFLNTNFNDVFGPSSLLAAGDGFNLGDSSTIGSYSLGSDQNAKDASKYTLGSLDSSGMLQTFPGAINQVDLPGLTEAPTYSSSGSGLAGIIGSFGGLGSVWRGADGMPILGGDGNPILTSQGAAEKAFNASPEGIAAENNRETQSLLSRYPAPSSEPQGGEPHDSETPATGMADHDPGGDARGGYLQHGRFDQRIADGGIAALNQYNLGSYSDGGRLLKGPGDGVSDSIPATIGEGQPARLADGEFVIPARIVSELGNGSTDAGAKRLYEMMDRIQKVRRKTKNVAANTKAAKYLPA